MPHFIRLLDARILLWLNGPVAAHPWLFKAALLLTDKLGDAATLATIAWLWFWRERASSPDAVSNAVMTRTESRARVIVFAAAGMAAYVTARLIAFSVDADRPFATFLPVHGIPGAFEGLRTYGSFPSDHAALLGALPVALLYWNRRVAWLWVAISALLVVARVAVGFHYPSDMVVGAAIGAVFTVAAMWLFDHAPLIRRPILWIARLFDKSPLNLLLYALGALAVAEFLMHFKHVLWLMFELKSMAG
jgi:membrane-associated phospholipid phosphatase